MKARQLKRKLMRDNGITTGRQWTRYRRAHGILTPRQQRLADAKRRPPRKPASASPNERKRTPNPDRQQAAEAKRERKAGLRRNRR